MAFSLPLASQLTGVTPHQLRRLRQQGTLIPEVQSYRPPVYSFRDLVALRTIAWLRAEVSAQRIRTAFEQMDVHQLTEHPSEYRFVTVGRDIAIELPDGGQLTLTGPAGIEVPKTFAAVFEPFTNFRNDPVVDFRNPRPGLEVRSGRQGGTPTVLGTRIPYDEIARVIDGETVTVDNIADFYPSVTPDAARDALDFDRAVKAG